ncbi:MAG: hypothetical protein AAF355_03215 [Myxococcota bacterium]
MTKRNVRRYLKRLRRRALLFRCIQALIAGSSTGLVLFAAASFAIGPVASEHAVILTWIGLGATTGLVSLGQVLPAIALKSTKAAHLLASTTFEGRSIESAVRSAAEIEKQQVLSADNSSELARAHHQRVLKQLDQIPTSSVLPWTTLKQPKVAGYLAALTIAAALLTASDRTASGAFALTHATATLQNEMAIADVVRTFDVELTFPAYHRRPPLELHDPNAIFGPEGTSVAVRVVTRVASRAAKLKLGTEERSLQNVSPFTYEGSFVLKHDQLLRTYLESSESGWLAEARERRIEVESDPPPVVRLSAPSADVLLESPNDTIDVIFEAEDEIGLSDVSVVVRLEDGSEHRAYDQSFEITPPRHSYEKALSLRLDVLDLEPGDEITLRVEARDHNRIRGPSVGRSEERTIRIASERTRRMRMLRSFASLVDQGVHVLADRLEKDVPSPLAESMERARSLRRATLEFSKAMETLALDHQPSFRPARRSENLLRLQAREAAAHRHSASFERRKQVNQNIIEALEDTAVELKDALEHARREDAAGLARELEQIRKTMASLLAELRRTDSAEVRQALRSALSDAEARMHELSARIAATGEHVPQEFLNQARDVSMQTQLDAIQKMRVALGENDLEEAARHLRDLGHKIRQLAGALGTAETEFAQERFGPERQARAEALDTLAGLEAEQHALARRSSETRRSAADRALRSTKGRGGRNARRLARRSESLRDSLLKIAPRDLHALERETLRRARQRLLDSVDAVSTSDFGEARQMMTETVRELENLSRELDRAALMFPGADGRMARVAQASEHAEQVARELQYELDGLIPDLRDFVDEQGRRQLETDTSRQDRVRQSSARLADLMEHGPDGTPLIDEGAANLHDAIQSMQQGKKALHERNPLDSSRHQEHAARRLTELRELLERAQRSKGQNDRARGSTSSIEARRVEIPSAEEHSGPVELRRRILDAMRESPPAGWEASVESYYEELLR